MLEKIKQAIIKQVQPVIQRLQPTIQKIQPAIDWIQKISIKCSEAYERFYSRLSSIQRILVIVGASVLFVILSFILFSSSILFWVIYICYLVFLLFVAYGKYLRKKNSS